MPSRRRSYDSDSDDGYDKGTTGGTLCSRLILLLVNATCIAFGSVLIYAGVTAILDQKIENISIETLDQPFIIVIVFGSALTFLSLCGFLGACCAIRRDSEYRIEGCCADRALMIYYVGILMMCAAMLYGGMLCLMYKDKATEYVDAYWDAVMQVIDTADEIGISGAGSPDAEAMKGQLKGHLRDGGIICFVTMGLNLLCAHFSAQVMGYKHTARRTMMMSNLVGIGLGILLVVLAFLPGSREMGVKDGYLPYAIGTLGVLATLLSVAGFLGSYFMSACLLSVNGVLLLIISILMTGFGIYAVANAPQAQELVASQWEFVREKFVDLCPTCPAVPVPPASQDAARDCCTKQVGLIVWGNMTTIGLSACVALIVMYINVFFSFFLLRQLRKKRRERMYKAERRSLKKRRSGGSSSSERRRRRRTEESDGSDGVSSGDDL
mmetsp:Transcript_57590/g.141208  ORF Transcript_57590/g.141208 Transcript_57590/m.141208 type:complete len:438 (+) Transcript_57590:149-1462(+)